jgi:hypothetical protein
MGALALAGLALACGSSPDERAAEPVAVERGPAAAAEPVGDPRLERWLATAIRSQTVEDGVKRVVFDLSSRATTKLDLAWSVAWYDRDGRALASPGTWRRISLPAGGAVSLEIRAPSPEADSWRLRAVDSRSLE